MISYIAEKVSNFIGQYSIRSISQNKQKWLKYGLEIIFASLGCIVGVLLSAILVNRVFESMAFLLAFITVRQYTGGFHADSYWVCWICSIATFWSAYFLTMIDIFFSYPGLIICSAILTLLIFTISPVENKHKPFHNQRHKYKCKIIACSLTILSVLLGNILLYNDIEIGRYIISSLFLIVILLIIGKIKEMNERRQYNGNNHQIN